MAQYSVKTAEKPIDCVVEVPGSKSITNRALLMAALSDGECRLNGVLFSDDSRHFLECLQNLGYSVVIDEPAKSVALTGTAGNIPNKTGTINVGSAGTAARFLTAMLALSDGKYRIDASEQMKKRPMKPLFDALTAMGAHFDYLENEGFLPVDVTGAAFGGALPAGDVDIDISRSTQFLSALMMVAPVLKNGLNIHITSEKTDGSYIRITAKMMRQFGCNVNVDGALYTIGADEHYGARDYMIEPDVSAACYFYAAAAITGGTAVVRNVKADSMQGDVRFIQLLGKMGCEVSETADGIRVAGCKDGIYDGIDVDMNDFSDQSMTLAVVAAFARTPSYIRNIGHIRLQESDRLHGIAVELEKLGCGVIEEETAIRIIPKPMHGGVVSTYDDHRMAMSFALAGLKVSGIVIDDYECCRKTFENYFEVLGGLTNGV
jgi:3-phosphoshikimate 1-carboxyvinyltransferase